MDMSFSLIASPDYMYTAQVTTLACTTKVSSILRNCL